MFCIGQHSSGMLDYIELVGFLVRVGNWCEKCKCLVEQVCVPLRFWAMWYCENRTYISKINKAINKKNKQTEDVIYIPLLHFNSVMHYANKYNNVNIKSAYYTLKLCKT